MTKGIVVAAIATALTIVAALMFMTKLYSDYASAIYQFTTEDGEVKHGWCKTNQPWPECKTEYNDWYKVKDYEKIK